MVHESSLGVNHGGSKKWTVSMISGAGDHVPATQAKRHNKPTLVWGQQNLTSWSFHGNLLRRFRRKFPARKKVITGKQWSESKSSSSWAIGSKDFNGFQWTFTWPSHCWVAACPLDAQARRPAAPAPLEQPERHGVRSAEPLALDKTLPWHVGCLDHPQLIESACWPRFMNPQFV